MKKAYLYLVVFTSILMSCSGGGDGDGMGKRAGVDGDGGGEKDTSGAEDMTEIDKRIMALQNFLENARSGIFNEDEA